MSDSEITCLLFDSLTEARQFCSEQVLRIPGIRFDVFDSSGRTKAPLLVMVHPSLEHTLPDSQRGVRARRWLALGLTIVGVPLIWLDYQAGEAALGFAFLGITLIVGAMRVLFLDMATRENERNRQARLARYEETMPEGASDAAGTRKE